MFLILASTGSTGLVRISLEPALATGPFPQDLPFLGQASGQLVFSGVTLHETGRHPRNSAHGRSWRKSSWPHRPSRASRGQGSEHGKGAPRGKHQIPSDCRQRAMKVSKRKPSRLARSLFVGLFALLSRVLSTSGVDLFCARTDRHAQTQTRKLPRCLQLPLRIWLISTRNAML